MCIRDRRLREAAEEEAIRVFAHNLRDLLLAAPAGARTTLGLDPGPVSYTHLDFEVHRIELGSWAAVKPQPRQSTEPGYFTLSALRSDQQPLSLIHI